MFSMRKKTDEGAAMLPTNAHSPISTWRQRWENFRYQYGYLIFAAILPAVLVYLIYLARGLYPFGDGCVLVLDLNGQYVSFYEALHDILHGEADLLYSFSRALGGEFLGIYDYYIASPFAMIIALFPQRWMLEGLLVLFMLKSALCGLSMGIYLHKHAPNGKSNRLVVIAFSILYALTSYAIVQQHNSMWIDAVLWLPLLALGIEELIKHGKFRLYVFTLAITVYSNFYIGYMVCIFTAAYWFFYYMAHNRNNENNPHAEKGHFLKSLGRIAIWSVLALGIAAIAILSARYALGFGKDDFSNPNWEITQKFNIFEFLYKFLPSSYDTVRPQGLPFVYCGVLTIIMVPAYFMSKKFSMREKIASAFFILFFVASFATSSLDLIWHGFQKPNWLNYRYSFMLCFFLITLAYRAFEEVMYTSRKALAGVVAFIGLYVVVLQQLSELLVEKNEKLVIRPFATIWLTIGCLLVYFILTCVWGKVKERQRESVAIILVFVVCVEVFLSGLSEMNALDKDVTYSRYSRYNNMIDTFRPITDVIHEYDDGFYRMEKSYFRKTNDNHALGIKGLSNSTSTLNRATIDFLREMGYASKSHWSKYMGGTPVNDSLLGIKYLITNEDMRDYYGEPIFTKDDYDYDEDFSPLGNYDVYYNPYAMSFAFGAADGWLAFDGDSYDNPFDRLNAMITVLLGESETVEVFVPATQEGEAEVENIKVGTADGHISYKVENTGKDATVSYEYTVPKNTELFFYYPTRYLREVKLEANGSSKGTFGGNETHRIISLGKSSKTELKLEVTIDNDSNNLYIIDKESYVYTIDREVWADAMTRLNSSQYIIDSTSTDSHLTGKVTTDTDKQLMFTSIPYDEGWNIYVDGKQVELYEANGALISFYVEGEGEHKLEMIYMPRTISLGFSISIVSLLAFIVILILYPFAKKVPYLRRLVIIEGEELPPVVTEEMLAGIEPGDIGERPSDWVPGEDEDGPTAGPDSETDTPAEEVASSGADAKATPPKKAPGNRPSKSGKRHK